MKVLEMSVIAALVSFYLPGNNENIEIVAMGFENNKQCVEFKSKTEKKAKGFEGEISNENQCLDTERKEPVPESGTWLSVNKFVGPDGKKTFEVYATGFNNGIRCYFFNQEISKSVIKEKPELKVLSEGCDRAA